MWTFPPAIHASSAVAGVTWDAATIAGGGGGSLTGGNLTLHTTSQAVFCQTTRGITSGKAYWEIYYPIGFRAGTNQPRDGIVRTGGNPGQGGGHAYPGNWPTDGGFGFNMYVSNGSDTGTHNTESNHGGTSCIHMVALDASTGKFWFGYNGVWWGGGNPAAGTGQTGTIATGGTWYPAAGAMQSSPSFYDVTGRFDSSSWTYAAPSGFSQIP
jgi:hypothetical protein